MIIEEMEDIVTDELNESTSSKHELSREMELMRNENHKLLFSLDKLVGKTFASVELKKALEMGYTIDKIHSALQYKRYNGLMRDYVAYFIKMKIENCKAITAISFKLEFITLSVKISAHVIRLILK
jgi:hypothetical protein